MKKWDIRWDLLLRYRSIKIIALWEGRLTTNHLCDTFGIADSGRPRISIPISPKSDPVIWNTASASKDTLSWHVRAWCENNQTTG